MILSWFWGPDSSMDLAFSSNLLANIQAHYVNVNWSRKDILMLNNFSTSINISHLLDLLSRHIIHVLSLDTTNCIFGLPPTSYFWNPAWWILHLLFYSSLNSRYAFKILLQYQVFPWKIYISWILVKSSSCLIQYFSKISESR